MPDCMEKAVICRLILFLMLSNMSTGLRQIDKEKPSILEEGENVCEIENSNRTVLCYCNSQEYQQASDSNCWIFSEVQLNDTIWDYFTSQSNIEKLKFNIRPKLNLSFVPTRALLHLNRLRELQIQYANIMELPEYTFANMSSLEQILLARNQIMDLKPHCFFNLENLESVTLDENRITELHRDVFIGTPNLKKLYLDGNILSVVHDGAFSHLHQLEELELGGNQLSDMSRDTFSGLKHLESLNLQENQIRTLRDFTFSELSNLRELNLEINRIEYISDRAFEGLSNMDRLILSENQLTSLSSEVFTDLRNLRYIDLRRNSLRTLNYATVSPFVENFKNISTYFLIQENRFVCDCRLSWMYLLKNETLNDQIRNTLDELTCQLDATRDVTQDLKHLFDFPQEELPCEEDKQLQQDTSSSVLLSEVNMGARVHAVNRLFIFSAFVMFIFST